MLVQMEWMGWGLLAVLFDSGRVETAVLQSQVNVGRLKAAPERAVDRMGVNVWRCADSRLIDVWRWSGWRLEMFGGAPCGWRGPSFFNNNNNTKLEGLTSISLTWNLASLGKQLWLFEICLYGCP